MQQSVYHYDNMLADQLRKSINNQGKNMLGMFQGFADNSPNDEERTLLPPPSPVANAAAQQDVQLEMLRILQEIYLNYAAGRVGKGDRSGGIGRGGSGQGNCNRNLRKPDNANFAHCITDQCCSTHGSCNHVSRDSTRKSSTHKDEATINNLISDSNAFRPPILM